MRNAWWMAPVAVLLVLGGVAGGIWLGRGPRDGRQAAGSDRKVSVPLATAPSGKDKPAANPAGGGQPAQTQPAPASGSTGSGAGAPKPPEAANSVPEPQRPPDADAAAFIGKLMEARMSGDAARVKGFLAPGLKETIRVSKADARITAYSADLLGSGDLDSFIFRLAVAFDSGQPGNEVAAENVRLTWRGGFKVAGYEEVTRDALALGTSKVGGLFLSRGQDTVAAATLEALPAMARPWGAQAGSEFGVGKEGWSVAAVSLTGRHVLWVTRGDHPLLGISQVSWNGAPLATPLDLLFEAGAVDAAWAPGADRYVAVTVAQPSGATGLYVYDVSDGQRLAPDLKAAAGGPDYTVRNIRWTGSQVVVFDLVRGGKTTGTWTFNVVSKALQPS